MNNALNKAMNSSALLLATRIMMDGTPSAFYQDTPSQFKVKPGENPDDQPLDQERVETLTTYINHLGEEKSAAFYVWLKKEYGATVVDNVKQGEYLNVYEALKKVYDSSKAK